MKSQLVARHGRAHVLVLTSLALLAACASDGSKNSVAEASVARESAAPAQAPPAQAPAQTPPAPVAADYIEHAHDGRIYVVGSERALQDFQETHHLAYTQTILGYGPKGETVVFEIDPKNDALGQRLRSEFDRRHRFYTEVSREGRIYVIGTPKLHTEFQQTGHLPYTATMIGKGPNRETLVFEIDTKNDRLVQRLKREFAQRHGVTL